MMDNELFDTGDNQCVLSYELLLLLQWLVENHEKELQGLIKKALALGLADRLNATPQLPDQQTAQEMHQSVLAFFDELENTLHECVQEQRAKSRLRRSLIPAAEHIDSSVCGKEVVADSLVQASETWAKDPDQNPRDLLLKELLRQWNPQKNIVKN